MSTPRRLSKRRPQGLSPAVANEGPGPEPREARTLRAPPATSHAASIRREAAREARRSRPLAPPRTSRPPLACVCRRPPRGWHARSRRPKWPWHLRPVPDASRRQPHRPRPRPRPRPQGRHQDRHRHRFSRVQGRRWRNLRVHRRHRRSKTLPARRAPWPRGTRHRARNVARHLKLRLPRGGCCRATRRRTRQRACLLHTRLVPTASSTGRWLRTSRHSPLRRSRHTSRVASTARRLATNARCGCIQPTPMLTRSHPSRTPAAREGTARRVGRRPRSLAGCKTPMIPPPITIGMVVTTACMRPRQLTKQRRTPDTRHRLSISHPHSHPARPLPAPRAMPVRRPRQNGSGACNSSAGARHRATSVVSRALRCRRVRQLLMARVGQARVRPLKTTPVQSLQLSQSWQRRSGVATPTAVASVATVGCLAPQTRWPRRRCTRPSVRLAR